MSKIAGSKFAWMACAALAVTAGSLAYGAAQEPPAAPAPPEAPAAPARGQKIVIVEKHGDADTAKHVRTITRDGKTFVFQTEVALSDAEVEQRIASAEARLPAVPDVPVSSADEPRMMKRRVIVVDGKGEQLIDMAADGEDHCAGKELVSDVDSSSEAEGRRTRVRVKMCGTPGEIAHQAMAQAVASIAKARAEIAQDRDLPEQARKEVLKELDAELARLKRAG